MTLYYKKVMQSSSHAHPFVVVYMRLSHLVDMPIYTCNNNCRLAVSLLRVHTYMVRVVRTAQHGSASSIALGQGKVLGLPTIAWSPECWLTFWFFFCGPEH